MNAQDSFPVTGTCQCGNVHYRITEPFLFQAVCHCRDCQKLSGTSFSISAFVKASTFELLQGELKSWRRSSDSGGLVDCFFCPTCGNRIYHQDPEKPGLLRLKPGTLDDTSVIAPQAHVWVSRKQAWVDIPEGIDQHDTQPEL